MTARPELFWGIIASMWIGNLLLVVLNLPLVGLWAKIVTIPYHYFVPAIGVLCCIGVYSVENNPADVLMMGVFGLAGYVLMKLDCEPAPLLLGFIIGPLLEENLRRAMLIARGDWSTFVTRPISAGLLLICVLALVAVASPVLRRKREEAFQE
jgi:TctA family transporter